MPKVDSVENPVRMSVTLSQEEYSVLMRLSKLEGKPAPTIFMNFVRDGKIFKVLNRVLKAVELVHRIKSGFIKKSENIDLDILSK